MSDKADEKEESEQGSFKVTDRRMFTREGEIRPEVQSTPKAQTAPGEEKPGRQVREQPRSERPGRSAEGPSEINFSSFLISLATTGMVHLGEIAEPMTGHRMENLDAAREMIEILSLLQEKTEGNLSPEESHLLENLLYELRMKFLAKSKAIKL